VSYKYEMITFAFMPAYGGDEREAILLAHNLSNIIEKWNPLRTPVLILHPKHETLSDGFLAAMDGLPVELIPFHVPEAFRDFPFAPKVFAAAQAEALTPTDLLVWLDSDTLILEPPKAVILPPEKMMAGCPVHLKNISSLAEQPINNFWKQIYARTPYEKIFNITTRVDKLSARAHFNAGSLVVRPKAGLLSAWKNRFEQTVLADAFRPHYKKDSIYAIFVHQAVLSAILMEHLSEDEILILPESYNYPVFLQTRFNLTPPARIFTLRYDQFNFFENQNLKEILLNCPDWLQNLLDKIH